MRPLALSLAFVLVGCGGGQKPSDTADTGPANYGTDAYTEGGTFYVMYAPTPDPIPVTDEFSIHVMVHAAADPSMMLMDIDSVSADADMPEHGHGMNVVPEVMNNGDGTFMASPFAFHMPGYWEISVGVTRGDTTEIATFSVDCCE